MNEIFEWNADPLAIRAEVERRVQSKLTYRTGGSGPASTEAHLAQLDTLADGLLNASCGVGKLPPSPATLRGRWGSLFVRAVNRVLFWYTPQIHAFQRLAAQHAKQQAGAMVHLRDEVTSLANSLGQAQNAIQALNEKLDVVTAEARQMRAGMDAAASQSLGHEERGSIYFSILERIGRDIANPVLDLGSGHGHWLQLLSAHGFTATGVDSDALAYVSNLPAASVGAVTGFDIIDRIRLDPWMELLDEVVRVLKPGGIAIFATGNALSAEALQRVVESRGLSTQRTAEWNVRATAADHPYAPPDYALIGRKPS